MGSADGVGEVAVEFVGIVLTNRTQPTDPLHSKLDLSNTTPLPILSRIAPRFPPFVLLEVSTIRPD